MEKGERKSLGSGNALTRVKKCSSSAVFFLSIASRFSSIFFLRLTACTCLFTAQHSTKVAERGEGNALSAGGQLGQDLSRSKVRDGKSCQPQEL